MEQKNHRAIAESARAWTLLEDGFDGERWPGEPDDPVQAALIHHVNAIEAIRGGKCAVKRKTPIDAEAKLLRLLADGPRESRVIQERLKIPERTFYRLRRRLGLVTIRKGFGRAGSWFLMSPQKTAN